MDNRSTFQPRLAMYTDVRPRKNKTPGGWKPRWATVSRMPEENAWGHWAVREVSRSYDRKVSDFTLPGKSPKESSRCPYHKPTQVDEVNIHRRSRERSLRN